MSVGQDSLAGLPFGLQRERHVDVNRRAPWVRRGAIALMAALCILALLNTFGQVANVSRVDSPNASLTLDSPTRLRGGLIFTTRFTIETHQKLNDAKLLLSPGWFDGMTLNAVAPQSNQQSSDARGTMFDIGSIDAGQVVPIWISWQTNPTTAGGRDVDLVLYDGDTPLLDMHRSVFIFP